MGRPGRLHLAVMRALGNRSSSRHAPRFPPSPALGRTTAARLELRSPGGGRVRARRPDLDPELDPARWRPTLLVARRAARLASRARPGRPAPARGFRRARRDQRTGPARSPLPVRAHRAPAHALPRRLLRLGLRRRAARVGERAPRAAPSGLGDRQRIGERLRHRPAAALVSQRRPPLSARRGLRPVPPERLPRQLPLQPLRLPQAALRDRPEEPRLSLTREAPGGPAG